MPKITLVMELTSDEADTLVKAVKKFEEINRDLVAERVEGALNDDDGTITISSRGSKDWVISRYLYERIIAKLETQLLFADEENQND